jgi:hypothetical protein
MLLENIDSLSFSKFIFNFFTKRIFNKVLNPKPLELNIEDKSNGSTIITTKVVTLKEYIEWLTSFNYTQGIINSIENCLEGVFLKDAETLISFIQLCSTKEDKLFKDFILVDIDYYKHILECNTNLIYSKEEIEEMLFNISKLNQVF